MSEWILSVVGIMVLGVLFDIILPDGQTSKYLKGIFALITLYVLIRPLPGLIQKTDTLDGLFYFEYATVASDADYAQTIYASRMENQAEAAEVYLKNKGFDLTEVRVIYDESTMQILYVNVDISQTGIDGSALSIAIIEIKNLVSTFFGLSTEEVRIIGY